MKLLCCAVAKLVFDISEISFWSHVFEGDRNTPRGGRRQCARLLDQAVGRGKKKPKYEFVIPVQKPFGMAASGSLEESKDNQWQPTFAILTGVPNELMEPTRLCFVPAILVEPESLITVWLCAMID